MIGAHLAFRMLTQPILSHSGKNSEDDTSEDDIKKYHNYLDEQFRKELQKKEEEKKQKKMKGETFKEARIFAINTPEALQEVEKTGFFTRTFNECCTKSIVGSGYFTRLFGYYEDFLIQILSKTPISSDEKDAIVQAIIFLTKTEKKDDFSKQDFKTAIDIGGYANLSHYIESFCYHDKNLLIQFN